MPTVREMAEEHARLGGTREMFHDFLGGFGFDSYSTHPDTVVGAQSDEPLVTEPVEQLEPVYVQPAVMPGGIMPASPTAPDPPQPPLGARPQPFGAALRPGISGAVTAQREALPSGVSDFMASRPVEQFERTRQEFEGVGSPTAQAALRSAGELSEFLVEPREPLALEAARGLESGLNLQQRASFGSTPERLMDRAQAAYVRLGSLIGTASGKAAKLYLQNLASMDQAAWDDPDEDEFIFIRRSRDGFPLEKRIRISAGDRKLFSRQWERDAKAALDKAESIAQDAVQRSGDHTVLRLAAESALDTGATFIDFITWLHGSDIPKAFWEEAPEADRRAVIAKALGMGSSPGGAEVRADVTEAQRKRDILLTDANERWIEMGDDLVGMASALAKEPVAVSKTHSMAILATLYPVMPILAKAAKYTGRPVSAATSAAAGLVGELMEVYAPAAAAVGRSVRTAVAERVAAFERTFVDPTKMADPEAQAMATEVVEQASRTEAGVTALGERLARERMGPEGPPAERIPAQEGRLVYEEWAVPGERPAPAQGFELHGAAAGPEVLPEVQATRAAMAARRAGPPEAITPDVLPASVGPETVPGQPLGQPLALPAPREPAPGPFAASREGAQVSRRLGGEPSAVELRTAAREAFRGRADLPLEQAALADAMASLYEVAQGTPDPAATVSTLILDAGGDVFAAADAIARARQPQRTVMRGEFERGAPLEPPEILPETAATRAEMQARRARAVDEPTADPARTVRALREQEAVSVAERKAQRAGTEGDLAGRHEVRLGEPPGEGLRLGAASEIPREPIPNSRALARVEAQPAPDLKPLDIDVSPPPDAPLLLEHNPRVVAESAVDPASFGYTFKRTRYSLDESGRLKQKPLEEGAAPEVVELEPVRKMSEAAERLIDDVVEVFGEEGVLTPGAVNKPQLAAAYEAALDARLPNNFQLDLLRGKLSERGAVELAERTGKPELKATYADEIARVLDEAKEGSIGDRVIEYTDPAGRPGSMSLARDVMTPLIESDPKFGRIVQQEMIKVNMRREGVRARQKAIQDTYGEALREWHPDDLTAAQAAKAPPSLKAELDYFIERYRTTGQLPPISRNVAKELLAEGRARIPKGADHATRESIMPAGLRRRLRNMEDASPGTLDSSRLADVAAADVRDVRLPSLGLRSLGPDGELGAPRLSIYKPLHRTQRWIGYDRGWLNELPSDIAADTLNAWGVRAANYIKAAKVPLNSSSWVGAVIGNTLSASMKLADPFASLKAVGALMDFYRFKAGLKTKYPTEWYDGLLRSQGLDSSFSKDLRYKRIAPKSSALGKKLMPRRGESMYDWLDRVRQADVGGAAGEAVAAGTGINAALRLFDHFDNGPKLYEAMVNIGRHLEEWGMLRDGQFKDLHLSRKKTVRATYRQDAIAGKTHMEVNGKRLTEAQMMALVSRAAIEPALRTYVDFSELPLIQIYKRNIPFYDMVGSPFSGWLSGTTTIWLMRRGIVGEILAGGTPRGATNSSRVMNSRALSQAAHGAKIGASIAALNASLDPETGALRRMSGYSAFDPGLQVIKPTDEEGIYSVWDVSNANSFEDLDWWLRLAESATHTLPELFGYADPSSVIEGQEYPIALMSDEEIARLPRHQQQIVREAQALHRDEGEGMAGLDTPRGFQAFRLSGAAAADALLRMVNVTDEREISAPHAFAEAARGFYRLATPGAHRRAFDGGLEHMADDDMELASIRSGEMAEALKRGDEDEAERLQDEIDDLLSAAHTKRFYAKIDRGMIDVELGTAFPFEDGSRGLLDKVLGHMLRSPRMVRLYDHENLRAKNSAKIKKAFLAGIERGIKGKVAVASEAASKARRDSERAASKARRGFDTCELDGANVPCEQAAAEFMSRAESLEEQASVIEDRGADITELATDAIEARIERMFGRAERERAAAKGLRRTLGPGDVVPAPPHPFGDDAIGAPTQEAPPTGDMPGADIGGQQ